MPHACLVLMVVGLLVAPHPASAGPSIPLEPFAPGLWTVRIDLPDGGGRWRFLLDTGSSHTVVATEAARRAGLTVVPGGQLLTPAGLIAVGETELPPFRLGGHPQPRRRVQVAPLDAVGGDIRLDGILGMDALAGAPFVLDLAGGQLLRLPPDANGRGEGVAVPARTHAGRVVVEVEVDGAMRAMVLDSGAQVPVVFEAAGSGASVTVTTAAGARPARAARAELRVGAVHLGGVVTLRVPAPAARTGSDGLLPVAVFSRVFVDAARGVVRVVPRR
jgi:Aspartyl protease